MYSLEHMPYPSQEDNHAYHPLYVPGDAPINSGAPQQPLAAYLDGILSHLREHKYDAGDIYQMGARARENPKECTTHSLEKVKEIFKCAFEHKNNGDFLDAFVDAIVPVYSNAIPKCKQWKSHVPNIKELAEHAPGKATELLAIARVFIAALA